MIERRSLTLATLDDVMPEVDRLLVGYTRAGNWTLGQACWHLALVIEFTMDGPAELGPHVLEEHARSVVKRRLLKSGVMASGIDVPGSPMPPAGLDDRVEAERLRQAILRFLDHPGPHAAHPFLGVLEPAEYHRFHCIHAAHHLSHLRETAV